VLTFLSALGTPISRRVEVWVPGEARQFLHRVDGFCERAGRLLKSSPGMMIERGHQAIGRMCDAGVPALSERASAELGPFGAEVEHAGALLAGRPAADRRRASDRRRRLVLVRSSHPAG